MNPASIVRQSRLFTDAQRRPCLPLLTFSAQALLAEIRRSVFPNLSMPVRVCFVEYGPLACVSVRDNFAIICIHQILNHPETPYEVISLILKHELLHLESDSLGIHDGQVHSREFWKAEAAIAPERRVAWAWICENLWAGLNPDRTHETVQVASDWKRVWNAPKRGLDACIQMAINQSATSDSSANVSGSPNAILRPFI